MDHQPGDRDSEQTPDPPASAMTTKLTNSETQTGDDLLANQSEAPSRAQTNSDEWIMLNVGGKIFTTTRTTLCTNEPNSMLARMFSQDAHTCAGCYNLNQAPSLDNHHLNHRQYQLKNTCTSLHHDMLFSTSTRPTLMPSPRDPSGAYMIDRSPKYFEPILNYLRHGKLIIDHDVNVQGVLEEAKFYGIVSLLPMLELETERLFKAKHQKLIKQQYESNDSEDGNNNSNTTNQQQQSTTARGPPLTRRQVIKAIISTSADTKDLRFQGCNLARADLSKLDLRHINFKYANLEGANLSGADLSFANLERSNLSKANLEGSTLSGANLAHANLNNSNLRTISASVPAHLDDEVSEFRRYCANFEAANLSYSNLEGSRLVGLNFHLARMKFANLQNCDLRMANLAGADLENCDLSGSALVHANLSAANVKGAQFELEVL